MATVTINVDQVAAVRALRPGKLPDPVQAAVLAELAGADGIACHLREDRRAIRDRDVYLLKEVVKTKLNLLIAPVDELYQRAVEVKPFLVMLMPFDTEDGIVATGCDIAENRDLYEEFARSLKEAGIAVGYFIDPDADAVKAAARAKADVVDLNAGPYINADTITSAEAELERLEQMAQMALKLGMSVSCGNGLNYKNIRPLAELDVIDEFSIGHAVVSRALMVGLDRAVREIIDLVYSVENAQ